MRAGIDLVEMLNATLVFQKPNESIFGEQQRIIINNQMNSDTIQVKTEVMILI